MRRLIFALSTTAVFALLAGPAAAADQKTESKKGKGHHADAFAFPKQIQLTADQQAKLDGLKKEFGPKLTEVNARVAAVLTPALQKTAHEAAKKARAEGKKGKELHEAVQAALGLSSADQAKLKDAMTARHTLMKDIRQQKMALLTDEQKAQLKSKSKAKAKA